MAANDLYPFSSDRGTPIPMEIVRPKDLVAFDFLAAAEAPLIIPAGFNICWVFATEHCVLRTNADNTALPAALVAGTNYSNCMFIPASIPTLVQLTPGAGRILGLGNAGKLYVNHVQQWAGIALAKQSSIG